MSYYDGVSDLIKKYIDTGLYEKIKCNRTNLNKIIKWTSSKYNEYMKEDVIVDIMSRINWCRNILWRYRCGSYAEGNHNRGKSYILYSKPEINEDYLICIYSEKDIKVYKLEVD